MRWCARRAGEGRCGPECVRGEIGHELFSGDPVEVVFKHFEFLLEGLEVVERDLDGAVVDFVEGVLCSLPSLS